MALQNLIPLLAPKIKNVILSLDLDLALRYATISVIVLSVTWVIIQICHKRIHQEASQDLAAIAGDDIVATQLDLAKAYIEMNQKPQQKILKHTIKKGNPLQKQEARQLIQAL